MNKFSINVKECGMGRGIELNKKMKEERTEKILSSGLRLFATKGLAATKIAHIANEAGMSQGLLYHYYKSKEEIFTELIRTAFSKLNFACKELEKQPITAREKIIMAIEALANGFNEKDDAGYYHILIAQSTMSDSIPDEAKAIIKKQNHIPYKIMEKLFEAGQNEGSVVNHAPADLAIVFWTSVKGLALHKATTGKRFKLPNLDIIKRTFLINSK